MSLNFLRTENKLLCTDISKEQGSRFNRLFVYSLLIFIGGLMLSNNSQAVTLTKLVGSDNYSPIDLKGNVLVVKEYNQGNIQGIGAFDIKSGSYVRLLDTNTPIPKGAGNFTTFNNDIVNGSGSIEGDKFIFKGYGDYKQFGLYSVPLTGGAISMIINQGTPLPGLNPPNNLLGQFSMSPYSASSTYSVFSAYDRNLITSVYTVDNATGVVSLLFSSASAVTATQPCPFMDNVWGVDINDNNIVTVKVGYTHFANFAPVNTPLMVSGSFSDIQNIKLGCAKSAADFGGLAIVASDTIVPGSEPNPRPFNNFAPEARSSIKSDENTVIFFGSAVPISIAGVNNTTVDLFGLYSSVGGSLYKLVDTKTPIPEGTGNFANVTNEEADQYKYYYIATGDNAYSVKGDKVLFNGSSSDPHENNPTGLFVTSTKGGAISKIIAVGDSLLGDEVRAMGSSALDGDTVVVRLQTYNEIPRSGDNMHFGIYLAKLSSNENPDPKNCLLNWAEANYPGLFSPVGAGTQVLAPYIYRYYKNTDAYLGISSTDNHVYYLGASRLLLDAGDLSGWVTTAKCQ